MGPDLLIRPAAPGEGERLRAIAIAAKSHWGYDVDRVTEWVEAGDFSAAGLSQKDVYVAEVARTAVAWAAAFARGDVLWLDDLWVEPEWIGKGIGTRLFEHVVARGRRSGARRLEWEAEEHAVGFYEKMGARYARAGEPDQLGRASPVMALDLG